MVRAELEVMVLALRGDPLQAWERMKDDDDRRILSVRVFYSVNVEKIICGQGVAVIWMSASVGIAVQEAGEKTSRWGERWPRKIFWEAEGPTLGYEGCDVHYEMKVDLGS